MHTKKACKLCDWFTRFWLRKCFYIQLVTICNQFGLYLFYQTGNFFFGYRILLCFVINSKKSDNSFFHAYNSCIGYNPGTMTFSLTLVTDCHANFMDTITKIYSFRRILH